MVSCHLGRTFPKAEIIGVDLSPVPVDFAKPYNVTFCLGIMPELAYSEDDERFRAHSFDFVFSRLLVGGMNKWQEYVNATARLLSPGGLVEFQDIDTRFYTDGRLCDEDWDWQIFLEESVRRGLDPQCATHMEVTTVDITHGRYSTEPETADFEHMNRTMYVLQALKLSWLRSIAGRTATGMYPFRSVHRPQPRQCRKLARALGFGGRAVTMHPRANLIMNIRMLRMI